MPGGDGTGPAGLGPMTGRAAGYCAGYPAPGFTNAVPRRGYWGRGGGGGGRGRRNWFYATGLPGWRRVASGYPAYGARPAYDPPYAAPFVPAPTREQETDALREQAKHLEDSLDGIKRRIEELEAEGK